VSVRAHTPAADAATASERRRLIADRFADAVRAHEHAGRTALDAIAAAAETIVASLARGGKVLAFGNGGSAADAQHLATELVGRFERERRGFAAMALTADTSVITSVANDYGFDRIFARQIEALGAAGDVAVAISTSGSSPNVVAGVEAARARGLAVVAITGRDGGSVGPAADIHVNVPEPSAARAQEVHRTIIHALCDLVERELAAAPRADA
jgi:D-sedoheptulose 7-phosphate isomerase